MEEDTQKICRERAEYYQAQEVQRERMDAWVVTIAMVLSLGMLCWISYSWIYFLGMLLFLMEQLWVPLPIGVRSWDLFPYVWR